MGATHKCYYFFLTIVKCVHFGSSGEFCHKSYHKVTWLSIFFGLFPCLGIYLIRSSACSNLGCKSIQTTTLFIICKILKMILTGPEFKFLNYQLNDNGTFSPKKIIAKSKYMFYGPVQATSFSCKSH